MAKKSGSKHGNSRFGNIAHTGSYKGGVGSNMGRSGRKSKRK